MQKKKKENKGNPSPSPPRKVAKPDEKADLDKRIDEENKEMET